MTWAVGAESRNVSTLDLARYADSTTTGRCAKAWAQSWLRAPRACRSASAARSRPSIGPVRCCASAAAKASSRLAMSSSRYPHRFWRRASCASRLTAPVIRGCIPQRAARCREQGVLPAGCRTILRWRQPSLHRQRPHHAHLQLSGASRQSSHCYAPSSAVICRGSWSSAANLSSSHATSCAASSGGLLQRTGCEHCHDMGR